MSRERKRDYAKEYAQYHASETQKKRRAMRNAARREMQRELGAAALRGRDVDHATALDAGGSNDRSNLRVVSKAANRGWRGKPKRRGSPSYG